MNGPTYEFAKKFGAKFGFDITMLVAIMTAISKMLEMCPKPAGIVAAVKSPSIRQQVAATRIVMEEMDQLSRREARRVANNLIADAAAEDDATIEAICGECVSGAFASMLAGSNQ